MADFCNQCAGELGLPNGDLADLGRGERLTEGYYWPALCEGCGFTGVDDDGNCVITVIDEGHFMLHRIKEPK